MLRWVAPVLLLCACHPGLARYAPNLDVVRPEYVDRTRFAIEVGHGAEADWYRRDPLARPLAARFDREVGVAAMARAFLGPFHVPLDQPPSTGAADNAVLTVSVTGKGLRARDVSGPASLAYAGHVWLTTGAGDRIWRGRIRCDAPWPDGPEPSAILDLWLAPPAALREALVGLAATCGQELAERLDRALARARRAPTG